MHFKNESIVVVNAFGKFKVGKVVDVLNNKYTVQTEDLKIYDDVTINSKDSVYIHIGLTKSFLTKLK